jgi:hypothetical protein
MNELQKLSDIRNNIELSTINEFETILFTLFVSLIIIFFLLLFLKKKYKEKKYKNNNKKKTEREISLNALKNLNFIQPKLAIYIFSENIQKFLNDENIGEYKWLEKELKKYKYKKEIEKFPKELENKIKDFIKQIKE